MKNFPKKLNKKMPKQPQLNVDVGTLPSIKCVCDNDTFIQAMRIKKLSKILSPDGQDKYINMGISICAKCHTPLPLQP